jgi:hypothetical protein
LKENSRTKFSLFARIKNTRNPLIDMGFAENTRTKISGRICANKNDFNKSKKLQQAPIK